MIVDLRYDQGGREKELLQLLGLFTSGTQGTETYRDGRSRDLVAPVQPESALFKGVPVVVLVSRQSASASELFAAYLRQRQGVTVLGQRTCGALVAAAFLPLPAGTDITRPSPRRT